MSLDNEEKPLGLKITQFITTNIFWYLIFSMIYWNINCNEWWLIKSVWGRVIIIFLELTLYYSLFKERKNGKD
jgi:uncharacterized membrane protein